MCKNIKKSKSGFPQEIFPRGLAYIDKVRIFAGHRRGGSRGGPFENSWIIKIPITSELGFQICKFIATF